MKKTMLCLAVLASLLSCNNETKPGDAAAESKDKKEEAKPAEAAPASMPYTAVYSSQFTPGNQKHAEKLLTLFKQWDDNKMDEGKNMFGDSVHFYTDQWEFHGTRDSFFAVSKAQRNSVKEVKTVVHAWIPTHSTDKNEDWVLVWSTAYTTDNKGKVDSANYQDTWRINSKGQFDLMYDYRLRAPSPVKKK